MFEIIELGIRLPAQETIPSEHAESDNLSYVVKCFKESG
jgi:hypothetical protein